MLTHKLTLADGTVLGSGVIRSVTLTEQVNDQDDLCPGAACAACAEIELWAPENKMQIAQGEELTLARVDTTAGTETQVGVFLAEKPVKSSANVYTVTAYDRMTLLDKDLSPWLREQQEGFPMSLTAFIQAVCARCGVALADGALDGLPNGGYQIAAFYADGLTGRQLIQWAAQAACRFARMTPDGKLTFGWYAASDDAIGPGTTYREGVVVLADGSVLYTANGERYVVRDPLPAYLQGSLSYEDYETAAIDKVQIRQTDDDVGVIYPPDETGANTLVLQGNLLLTTATAEALRPVAQAIFETMQGVSYTPLRLSVLLDGHTPTPGDIIQVTDAYGRVMTAYVMARTISGQKATLECTGNATRDGVSAVNSQKYQNLQGKVLELQMGVDGLRITNQNLQGQMAQLELTVDGFETQISGKLDEDDAETLIQQGLDSLTLSATAGDQSSTLTLKAGGTVLSSAEITFEGMVTFAALSGSGTSVINGDNITTGTLGSEAGNTVYDLDAGTIRTGRSTGSHVNINDRGINWYVERSGESYLTGVMYSEYGKTYIGCNSQYSFFGWFSGATPSVNANKQGSDAGFGGLYYDHSERLIHCVAAKFEIPGRIECQSLGVNGREI